MREIYNRDPDDRFYNPVALESKTEIEALITKLKMIMYTNKGEVYGEPDFGLNLEDLIFSFGVNQAQLEAEMRKQIDLYIPEANKFDIQFDIQFYHGKYRDEVLIDISINKQKYIGIYV